MEIPNGKWMYLIDQEIANQVAQKVPMKYELTERMFRATEEEAEAMEMEIRAQVEKETGSDQVARAVSIYLPLLLESEALSKSKTNQKANLPEILSEREAALIAQREIMLSEKETQQTEQMLTRILQRQLSLMNY
ncbi:hypothetical protein [uncultured Draconibacterium sp.]|uniref:hypothetical protein n=1 Tax=uncultured Draconibacterium sp. TaxID=1573823 RepID=UPI0032165500